MDSIDLSDFFSTKAQAEDFLARLELVLKEVYETDFNPQKALLEQFGIKKTEAFMTLMRNNNVNAQSRGSIKDFIEKVKQKISTLTVVSLVLAFEPNEETLQALSRWFILNTKKQVVFEITVDRTLIGGAAILSNGKYLDYSIQPQFESIMNRTLFGQRTPPKLTKAASK